MIRNLTIALIVLLTAHSSLDAQRNIREISFEEFLQTVLSNNLELIVENYNVSIAEAAVAAARVFEDPELEMIFPVFDEDEFSGFPRNIEFEMEIPVELFGKRRNRIRQARAENYASQAQLDDFLRYLRADAARSYVDLLTHQLVSQRMNLTMDQLNELIEVNQALFNAGEIGEIDLIQTRLEARNFQAEIFDLRTDYAELMGEVYFLMGGITTDSLVFTGDLQISPSLVTYDDLREQTLENRPDILAAQRNVEAGEFALKLSRAERLPDISLIMGYHNEDAVRPGPGFSAVYGGLIIPLKFSGFNSGEFRMSCFELQQAQTELSATMLDAEAGLQSAWQKYQLLIQKRLLFTESILQDAERVRDAIVYSYQRGDLSLLEVLEAQRTMNEVYMNYYETLSQFAVSLVELSKESGQWLVEF